MIKKISAIFVLTLICLISINGFCAFEKPVGFVNDYAGVLSADTISKLNASAQKLKDATSAELVVVCTPSLEQKPIDDYAYELFNSWKIGDKNLDNGVLLVIAPNERKTRIEVGKGLEGRLNDGKTGYIQDDFLIPALKNGDYNKGVTDTFYSLFFEIAKEYNIDANTIEQGVKAPSAKTKKQNGFGVVILMILFVILIIYDVLFNGGRILAFIIIASRNGGGRGNGGGFGGSGGFGGFGGGSSGGGGSSRSF